MPNCWGPGAVLEILDGIIYQFVRGGGRGLTQGSPRAILGQLEESLWPDEAGRKQPRRSTAARVDPKADLGQPRGTPTATLQSVPGLFLVMPWQRSRSLTECLGLGCLYG